MLHLLFTLGLTAFVYSFDWQGHRGARGLYPENTINGMKEALLYPVNTLEMDVVISKDGEVVVSHEPWMSPEICLDAQGKELTDKVNIYKLTTAELLGFDCGTKFHPRFPHQKKVKEHKPLLKDLLSELEKFTSARPIQYSVEIKSTPEEEVSGFQPPYQIFTDKVMEILKALPSQRVWVQSFDWRVLKYLHKKYPTTQTVALRERSYSPSEVVKDLGFNPTVFAPDFNLLKESDVAWFHSKGIKVIPWTVNSPGDMKKLRSMGVDGIITDYPNYIAQAEGRCGENQSLFENKCVKVPKFALPSAKNPGWNCLYGYYQRRNKCRKIKLPAHAQLDSEGKAWVCEEGYERYRFTCRKKK
jgi:glycerophosphoryl diester phosphodiesterase